MANPISPSGPGASSPLIENKLDAVKPDVQSSDMGKRFEQMLWAEMLTHAGLEKSFTQSGGEAASAFSRYLVEAISEDLTEKYPLGLTTFETPSQPTA